MITKYTPIPNDVLTWMREIKHMIETAEKMDQSGMSHELTPEQKTDLLGDETAHPIYGRPLGRLGKFLVYRDDGQYRK